VRIARLLSTISWPEIAIIDDQTVHEIAPQLFRVWLLAAQRRLSGGRRRVPVRESPVVDQSHGVIWVTLERAVVSKLFAKVAQRRAPDWPVSVSDISKIRKAG
jgi:hypothetical protein